MSEFNRELRYWVIKRKHLSPAEDAKYQVSLPHFEAMQRPEVTPECVVVESDWPEYETVWAMIQARVEGRECDDPLARIGDALKRKDAEIQRLNALLAEREGEMETQERGHMGTVVALAALPWQIAVYVYKQFSLRSRED